YVLTDRYMILRWVNRLVPKKWREKYDRILYAIDKSFGNYIKGQLLLSITVALVTYAIYQMIGLVFSLFRAIFTSTMNVVTYFGSIIGSIPALAITATVSYKLAISVVIANAFVQLLESSLLSPYIMAKSVDIHPVFLIFLLLLGAEAGGVIGMILVVPTATITRGVFRELKSI